MSAQPATHLRLVRVNDEIGEVEYLDSHALEALEAELEKLRVDVKMAQRDVKSKNRRIAELERDLIRERLEHPDREFIKKVGIYWWRKCRGKDYNGRRRINPMSPDRFDAVAALAEMQELKTVDGKRVRCWKYEAQHFKAAIDGAAFDPFTPVAKNGVKQPQNDLEQICRNVSKFEASFKKAPYYEDRDDYEFPPVPGFVRLSPREVARAHEARKDMSGFQLAGHPTGAHIGGITWCASLCVTASERPSQRRWLTMPTLP